MTTINRGNLFSAIPLADSKFGREWSRLRAGAVQQFPDLKLAQVEDLHITVVYIGGGWNVEDLDRIRPLALIVPKAPTELIPEVTHMGAHNQVVVVELHITSGGWADEVTAAKATLNQLGLKNPESYDANFRSHLALAESKHPLPNQTEIAELARFQTWLAGQVARNPKNFTITLGPETSVRLLLSNLPRPKGTPEYVPLEDFLARHPAAPSGP